MRPSPDYNRRRAALVAFAVLLLASAGREAPVIGTVSITIDERRSPRLDGAWSPALATVLAGVGRGVVLAREYLSR